MDNHSEATSVEVQEPKWAKLVDAICILVGKIRSPETNALSVLDALERITKRRQLQRKLILMISNFYICFLEYCIFSLCGVIEKVAKTMKIAIPLALSSKAH